MDNTFSRWELIDGKAKFGDKWASGDIEASCNHNDSVRTEEVMLVSVIIMTLNHQTYLSELPDAVEI